MHKGKSPLHSIYSGGQAKAMHLSAEGSRWCFDKGTSQRYSTKKKAKEHTAIVKKIAELQDALQVEDMTSLTEAAGPSKDQGLPSPLSHLVEAADPEMAESDSSRYGHIFSLNLNPWMTVEMSIKPNQNQMNPMTTI